VLASILVPMSLAPMVAQFGLGFYVGREAARSRPPAVLAGSIGLPLLLIGVLVAFFADSLASIFIDPGTPPHTYLTIGFSLLWAGLLMIFLRELTWGREQWARFSAVQAIPHVLYAVGLGGLFVAGRVTVDSAFIVFLISGLSVLAPLLWFCRDAWVPRLDLQVTREGMVFGAKSWLGEMGNLANERADQLLMIRLVPAFELGLYAVAASVSAIPQAAALAIGRYLLPRVAGGEEILATRGVRLGLVTAAAIAIPIGFAAPVLLPLVFGPDFTGATVPLWILLVATLPFSVALMLRHALTGGGVPVAATYAEVSGLAFTVPALLVTLPILGAVGAAGVSVAAYALRMVILLVVARRRFGRPIHEFVVPRPDDCRWVAAALRARRRS